MQTALSQVDAGGQAPQPTPRPSGLGKRQKAAIVVRLLLAEGADIKLTDLPGDLQEELTRQMSSMRHIDRETLGAVVTEFVAEIERIGLSFPADMSAALSVLGDTISAETASRIRQQAGLPIGADPWVTIGEVATDILAEAIAGESVEVAAVILSKLKVSKAAELLSRMPGDRARRIAYAMSLTGTIAPDTVAKIGASVVAQLDAKPVPAFEDGPVERVGAILNFSPAATRDDVLAGLEETDARFAEEVRRAIFTFANIPARIDPRDVPKIVRVIDTAVLTKAVAAAEGKDAEAVEFLLANLSQRLAAQLREDAEALEGVKAKEAEAAMSEVVVKIREMVDSGEIILVAVEDDDED